FGQALRTATRGYQSVAVPGTQTLEIRAPGFYTGLYLHKDPGPMPVEEIARLAVSIHDIEGGVYLPVEAAPPGQVFRRGSQTGMLLFQCEFPQKGRYLLDAVYPADVAGPKAEILLLHEALQNNRSDIAAGIIFCLVFCGAGTYVMLRARRQAARDRESAQVPSVKKKQR
ncbi:MAG TPA: hypothetical protein P5079_06025, partial [Elusimicrobiota bacterium]|nr:hypothetical protein [Elusimicrobiota bacterium]